MIGILALGALLLLNRLLVPRFALNPPVFWTVQAGNVAGVVYMVGWGLPGSQRFPVVTWLVSALLVFHVVQNLGIRSRKRWEVQRVQDEKELRRLRSELKE